jgi:hypothetical protein
VKFDVGKLGRGYLIVLLLVMTILLLSVLVVGIGRLALKSYGGIEPALLWRTVGVLFVATLGLGVTLWGVIRRRRWSYFLSLAIYACLILTTMYSLNSLDQSDANLAVPVARWEYLVCIVLYVVALGWLMLPSTRAQFSPVMRTQ